MTNFSFDGFSVDSEGGWLQVDCALTTEVKKDIVQTRVETQKAPEFLHRERKEFHDRF